MNETTEAPKTDAAKSWSQIESELLARVKTLIAAQVEKIKKNTPDTKHAVVEEAFIRKAAWKALGEMRPSAESQLLESVVQRLVTPPPAPRAAATAKSSG